jgi:hypothetical protein
METKENLLLKEVQEIWKDVLGYEGIYQISNLGRVKSLSRRGGNGCLKKDTFLKPCLEKKGYFRYKLYKNSKGLNFLAHRLVANSFIENPFNKISINHIDSIKTNNSIYNLEWVSIMENNCHKSSKIKSSSKYVGVSYYKALRKWEAYIGISGKLIYLGRYNTEVEAYRARCDYEKNNKIENKYL